MTPVLDREALRRAALSRAARQGAPIARRRVFWRHAGFWARRTVLWLLLPAGAIAGLGWWWLHR